MSVIFWLLLGPLKRGNCSLFFEGRKKHVWLRKKLSRLQVQFLETSNNFHSRPKPTPGHFRLKNAPRKMSLARAPTIRVVIFEILKQTHSKTKFHLLLSIRQSVDQSLFLLFFQLRTCNSIRGFVRWSVSPLVHPLVRDDRVEKQKNNRFRYFLRMFECGMGVGVWMGVGCPCPPVRNDILTPLHL